MVMTKVGRSRLVAAAATVALAAGLVGLAGVALAEDEPNASETHEHAAGAHQHQREGDSTSCHGGAGGSIMEHVAEAAGLDRETLMQAIKDGKSINTILEENGLDPATVQAEALALLQEHLDQAVADGKLTQEQADNIAARAAEALPDMMEKAPLGAAMRAIGGRKALVFGSSATAATVIGIDAAELAEALRSGQTIADVATANGVNPQTVIDALVAEMNSKIDQAVADGKITAERAEEMKASAVERTTAFVNEGHPKRGAIAHPGRMR